MSALEDAFAIIDGRPLDAATFHMEPFPRPTAAVTAICSEDQARLGGCCCCRVGCGPQGGDLGLLLLLLLLLRDSGLAPRHILIWVKNRPSFSIGRLDYDYQHEPIIYGWQPGGPHHWHADSTRTSILAFDRPQASPDHPTTKPLALIAHLIENSTADGDIVCDPFAGSGTTLLACEQHARRARVLEIDPRYCDVICARYQAFTGTVPVLERTGEPHPFLESAP